MRRLVFLFALCACSGEPAEPNVAAQGSSSSATATSAASSPVASASVAEPTESASAVVEPSSQPSALPTVVIERDENGLWGKTIDFDYDGADVKMRSRAYSGRVFVHAKTFEARKPVPLIVFFHGLNRAQIPHRWMGGGDEGDVRKILSALIESGEVEPHVLAGPGSVEKDAVGGQASFPVFDFPKFVAQVVASLPEGVEIDPTRIIVTGHSGAGCSAKGGIVSAIESNPFAIVSIDTCMPGSLASSLGAVDAATHVIVTWQTVSWDREFEVFRKLFMKEVKSHPPNEGTLRELDQLPARPKAHDATVKQTFDKWLPRLLPPKR
ncbi:MAG: hypothetical protein U0271_34635 [Polyangiaceae bacterium]